MSAAVLASIEHGHQFGVERSGGLFLIGPNFRRKKLGIVRSPEWPFRFEFPKMRAHQTANWRDDFEFQKSIERLFRCIQGVFTEHARDGTVVLDLRDPLPGFCIQRHLHP